MLNRVNSGAHRVLDAFCALRVRHHLDPAPKARFLHDYRQFFADRYRAEPRRLATDALGLAVVNGPAAEEPRRTLRLNLAGRERRVCHGFVAGDGIGPGEFSVVEVVTSTRPREDEMGRQAVQGSFGMVIFGRPKT